MPRTALGIVSLARKDADLALAERLFENLRNLILDGLWRYGEKLPGTRIIARDAGVSRWTAVVAIDMLIAEGLVEARKRSGTYVAWQGGARKEASTPSDTPAVRPNVPFALSVPALDLFPMHVWRRLQARRWRQMPAHALEDGDVAGWPALRQAIAEYAATVRNIHCSADQVFVVPGVEAAGRLTAQVLCRPQGLCWIEDPGPPNARAIATSAQLVPIGVGVDKEGLQVDDGRRLAPSASLAVVTPSVQFPLGVRMSDARRQDLLAWASATGAWIMEVDHIAEFPVGAHDHRPLAAAPGGDRVVYFDTFGKLLFPSLRLSFMIVPRDAAPRFREAVMNSDRPPGVPNQIVLADFLASGQFAKHLRRCREAYTERRDALHEALKTECGDALSIGADQRGLFVCARLADKVDDVALVEKAREQGVVIDALSRYYERKTDDRGILLGYSGYRPEQLRDAAKKLALVLKSRSRNFAAAG